MMLTANIGGILCGDFADVLDLNSKRRFSGIVHRVEFLGNGKAWVDFMDGRKALVTT